ncbi:DUF6850 family outer membrane beta-barrel protein [Maribellus sp. YY47]|uniref:DUF6850 family outer membrane beta-barrel protein n=1 Tax=Maribellus sp. YY47 TaxID=2929486 RepID=UPI0020019D5E|nr:DUF6850 family outer membrane beta-barrel protein [Maribellus sp. YY47]MCK3683396.1 hypothetical protein [Maribellus sp. YY47]
MTKFKTIFLLFSALCFAGNVWANTSQDSTHSIYSFRLYELQNPWLNSNNISGIIFNPKSKLGRVYGGYQVSDGDFHLTRNPSHQKNYSLFSESYLHLKDNYFYGKFEYRNSDENGNLWVGVFDPNRETPYIIGDSVSGANYHKESFHLSGGIAKKITENISSGLLAEYKVGVAAKQKDPRPENIVTEFSVSPSVIFFLQNTKLGINLGFRNRKEDIEYKQIVTNDTDPTYFMFKGLGFYSSETAQAYYRFQSQNSYSGGMQVETSIRNLKSLTEINANYSLEKLSDGKNNNKKSAGGDWKSYKIEFNQQLTKENQRSIQKLSFNGSYFNGDGIEYNQQQAVNDDNFVEYITLSKNLKFNRQIYQAKLNFDFLRFQATKKMNWLGSVYSAIKINREKYYYIPEVFNAEYSNIESGFSFIRNFNAPSFSIAPEMEIKYKYNLSREINLASDATIKQNKNVYLNDFSFYTSDWVMVSLMVNCELNLPKTDIADELFIKIGFDHWETTNLGTQQDILTTKIGFIF